LGAGHLIRQWSPHAYSGPRGPARSVGPEGVDSSRIGIWHPLRTEAVVLQVELVSDEDLGTLRTLQLTYLLDSLVDRNPVPRQDERPLSRRADREGERRWYHVHLPVADLDVAVASKRLHVLVRVHVLVIGV